MIRYTGVAHSSYAAAEAAQQSLARALLDYKLARGAGGSANGTASGSANGGAAAPPPPMALLAFEMTPTYTFGRRQRGRVPAQLLEHLRTRCRGATVHETTRGGFATFHGPGQLVMYPVLDLQRLGVRLRDYVCVLEKSIIAVLGQRGVRAEQRPGAGMNGVFAAGGAPQKLASVGVHVRRNVTTHGLALNVALDPFWFHQIVPCNLDGIEMASMTDLGGGGGAARSALTDPSSLVSSVSDELAREIAQRLGAQLTLSPDAEPAQ